MVDDIGFVNQVPLFISSFVFQLMLTATVFWVPPHPVCNCVMHLHHCNTRWLSTPYALHLNRFTVIMLLSLALEMQRPTKDFC